VNTAACTAALDEIFADMTLDEAAERLAGQRGVWARFSTPREVSRDPQAEVNGYVRDLTTADGSVLRVVTAPAQFDESVPEPVRAPALGEHTDAVLLELGMSRDELDVLKRDAAIG
jgi:crotonobetainyl-CoA:carnitine CoA-transferase CaiB-like acyl-CoA transferase